MVAIDILQGMFELSEMNGNTCHKLRELTPEEMDQLFETYIKHLEREFGRERAYKTLRGLPFIDDICMDYLASIQGEV
ncbi:hypothetical protein [Eremococcus coleocola]|uniref:hypothetical protein n=1 Tax=Eremococcus coleocola TaxID=88132 RepID=UPI000416AD86|nr:hypothetical protein [Eremococcus coleocola]